MKNTVINQQIQGFLSDPDMIASLANISSVIYYGYSDLNWAGFYFVKGGQLIVGPFQGKPACTPIPFTKGVCGRCYREKAVQRIDDVLAVKDHIACDSASRSELCVPVIVNGEMVMEIDLDSPVASRFDDDFEKEMLKAADDIASAYLQHNWHMD
ncbi:MAG: GAF domain-containing protein [Bulleidia sp.]|nr:GAF domain-containing protein [Erysipelotrichaceae bacterium]MDD6664245.1 GAF domain-containing protein [Bulleidia sp.]HAW13411.1 histidine kinase [Erysipelotrichaceae bacterium]